MLGNFLLILLKSAIPIGLTSFGLVWWAQRQDYLGGSASMREYEDWQKAESQNRREQKKQRKVEKNLQKQQKRTGAAVQTAVAESPVIEDVPPKEQKKFDPLHSKWMKFGGGFYGVVAFLTYVVIELADVRDFLVKLPNLFEHGLVNLLVQFFIESLKNFITAISWPIYWLDRIDSEQWLWFIGAYAGYWLGSNAAFRVGSRRIQ